MRTAFFLIALIAVSSVAATTFNKKIQTNPEFKNQVNNIKSTNIGKMIMTLA
jgi:cytochrome c biogenesis protein ResB